MFRIVDPQRLEHDGINQREDRRSSSDAQRESEHRDHCEARRLPQSAESDSQVLTAGFEKRFPPRCMDGFPRHLATALFEPHRAKGLRAGHPPVHLLLNGHFHEVIQFLAEITGIFISPKQ